MITQFLTATANGRLWLSCNTFTKGRVQINRTCGAIVLLMHYREVLQPANWHMCGSPSQGHAPLRPSSKNSLTLDVHKINKYRLRSSGGLGLWFISPALVRFIGRHRRLAVSIFFILCPWTQRSHKSSAAIQTPNKRLYLDQNLCCFSACGDGGFPVCLK